MVQAATADVVVRSRAKGEKVYANVQAQLDRLASKAKTLGLVAGAAAIGGLAILTVKAFESADALAKSAEKIGIGTTKLASLNRLAVMAGGSVGGMQESLVKATKRLGEFNATGGGAAGIWLKRLNLDTQELAALSPDKLFEAYAEAIGGMTNRGEQLAAMSALMGDESRVLIGLVDQGSEAFTASQEEVERYALALGGVDSAKIEAANDAIFKVKERFLGVGNVIASKVAPIITAMANRFLDSGTEADVMGNVVDKVMDGIATGAGIVADAIFGWKIVFAAARVAVLELWAFTIGGLAKIERALAIIGNKMASVFGGEQIDVRGGFLTRAEDSLKASSEHAHKVLQELIASEKPSLAIADALAKARNEAELAATATAAQREQLQEIAGEGSSFEQSTKDEAAEARAQEKEDKLRERLATKAELLATSLLNQEEREIQAFDRRHEILELALENQAITKERFLEIELALQERHEAALTKITNKGLTERQKFEQKSGAQKTKQVFSDMANITQGVATHNKTLFRINQIAAIANAIINTAEGVTQSLAAYPMPLAAVMAAIHLAAGLAQIASIRSASFGGGSTPSAIGAIPTINNQPVSPFDLAAVGQGSANIPGSQITIIVEGSLIGDEGIRLLLQETIGELIDADEILINPESRQAEEIRTGSGSGG